MQIISERKVHNIRLNKDSRDDLQLAIKFINKVQQGVSMNLLTARKPDIIYVCDASEYGLGGFASHGMAWTYQIPLELRNRAHINILEYLAQIISIWINIIEGTIKPEDCLLSIGNNTSALGWMRRSNFRQKDDSDTSWRVKQQLGRKLASLVLDADAVLYKQWLKGQDNVVADSLSKDNYYLNANTHTLFLKSSAPQQLPPNFTIKPVPKETCLFITSMLQQLPDTQQQSSQPKPSELAHGNIGLLTSLASGSKANSSKVLVPTRKISSCRNLHKPSGQAPSLKEIMDHWLKEQSQPPLHMWHRPSGQTINMTPDWTKMARHALHYKNNSEGTQTLMEH